MLRYGFRQIPFERVLTRPSAGLRESMAKDEQNLKYGAGADFSHPNTSHSRMMAMIGKNKSVLEFGCASGYMSKVLRENGCRVTGIEFDAAAAEAARAHCERVIVANLNSDVWTQEVGDSRFEVAVFGDVLEHLTDPQTVLRKVRDFLAEDGYVVASLPNIAHGSVRMDLLSGEFQYRRLGLLDETHVRFFTRYGIEELFCECGYLVAEMQRCYRDIFDSELNPVREIVPAQVLALLEHDEDARTYQYVCKAVPADAASIVRHVSQELASARKQVRRLEHAVNQQKRTLSEKTQDLAGKEATLQAIFNSRSWKLLNRYREFKARVSRQGLAHSGARLLSKNHRLGTTAGEYQQWIEEHERPSWDADKMRSEIRGFQYAPKISVIMPVYNTRRDYLEKAINSVLAQMYDNWELCICDDHSSARHVRPYLEERAAADGRIKVAFADINRGISAASNQALELASGEFVGFLDHDDELSPAALYEVVKLLQQHPDADYIYSDEDKLELNGKRCDAFFKPDWSPEFLLSCNYVCHFGVYRKALLDEVGGFRSGFDGSQDYDLILRMAEKTRKMFHIPKVLYHWRKVEGSTSAAAAAKNYTVDAGKRALREHLERRGIAADVLNGELANVYRVRPQILGNPLVSIIIPTRDGVSLLQRCITSIEQKTSYPHYEILVVDNGSVEPETAAYLRTLRHRVLPFAEPFNFSRINNFAARQAHGSYLVLLNNDTEVISPEWLSSMLELCQMDGVGIVGGKLYYPDRSIQHAGVVLGLSGGVADHAHKHFPGHSYGYFGTLRCIRNYSAVTAACMMVRKEAYDAVGGFDEELQVAFNDIDFCLRVRDRGYRIVWTPYCELIHYESVSRGFDLNWREVEFMQRRWGQALLTDPYYNPNLTLERGNFRIRL